MRMFSLICLQESCWRTMVFRLNCDIDISFQHVEVIYIFFALLLEAISKVLKDRL
jgi:hypothetical protein